MHNTSNALEGALGSQEEEIVSLALELVAIREAYPETSDKAWELADLIHGQRRWARRGAHRQSGEPEVILPLASQVAFRLP